MEIVADKQAVEVETVIDRLLGIRRMIAQVQPIMHEVKHRSERTGKTKLKKEPSGDFLVCLFDGGVLPIDATDAAAAEAKAVEINQHITAMVRAAVERDRQEAVSLLTSSHGIDGLKTARTLLGHLRECRKFGLRPMGPVLVPEQPGAGVRFVGTDANVRATKFASAVNKYLTSLTTQAEDALRERLKELASKL